MTETTTDLRHERTFTPAEIRRIAAEAGVEPRTAAKYIRGERVLSTCADRISRALVVLEFTRRTERP